MMDRFKYLFSGLLLIIALLCTIITYSPLSVLAQEGDLLEDKNELEARVNISVSWDKHDEQENSNLEETGSISASVSGNLVLMENRGGVVLFYPSEKGMTAQASYQNIRTDKKSGEQYVTESGSGSVQILSPQLISDPQKQGHLEWMGFSGPAGIAHALQLSGEVDPMSLMQAMTSKQNMDHYTFSIIVPIPTVITDRDGKTTEGSVPISFGLIADELKSGANSNSVSWTSEQKEVGFFYQNFMDSKYEPPESGDVQYQASWSFGETPPSLEIHREVNGKWINITDETNQVIVGEKIKLRAVVIPEDKDTGQGEWILSGNGQTGDGPSQNHIKRYEAHFRTGGRVIHLENLNSPELEFYWTDGGSGESQYVINYKEDEISAQTKFEIKRPNYKVIINASQENEIKNPERGSALDQNECWGGGAYDAVGVDDLVIQYQGIRFKAENLDKGIIEGEEQWVQILEESYFLRYDDGNRVESFISDALDVCYPYQRGSQTMDAPGIVLEKDGKRLQAERKDGVKVDLMYAGKTQKNRMYLMFKPVLAESEWVPIKVIHWTWHGEAGYSASTGWQVYGDAVDPDQPEAVDTAQYPKWDKNSADDSAYQIN